MDTGFLGIPDVGPLLFLGLSFATFLANYFSVVAGAAGGLMLLILMASFLPPLVLLPLHTLVQLGCGGARAVQMWPHVLKGTLVPFTIGCALGAAIGARIFVALPNAILMSILALFVLVVTWLPSLGTFGPERGRFGILGFVVTLLGVFVSATGTLVGAFTAAAAPDRRNHVATLAALMAITHTAKMAAFTVVGFAIGAYLPLIAGMIAGGILGNYAGAGTLNRMREEWFRLCFKLVMTALSIRLLWVAIRDSGLI